MKMRWLLGLALACWLAGELGRVRAQDDPGTPLPGGFPMILIVDENANGFWSPDGGATLVPLDGQPGFDPISGLGPIPCYVLPQSVAVGDLLVLDQEDLTVKDMLRFPDDGTGTASVMYFLSDNEDNSADLADVGIPDPQDIVATQLELNFQGIDLFLYDVVQQQDGTRARYIGISDITPVADFEPPTYSGSSGGVVTTGQAGWYIPALPVGGTNHSIYTYAGNTLGLPANPIGKTQFDGGQAPGTGGTSFPRAQNNFNWSTSTMWTVSYDTCTGFGGTLPAVDNLSSFSLQDSTMARYYIQVNTWANPTVATAWNAGYQVFSAAGVMTATLSPGTAWQNLAVGHWYRQSTTFDFSSNRVLQVTIMDLSTGTSASFEPPDWYLAGGSTGGGLPLPTALRFFVGGGVGNDAGNITAWDNLSIESSTAPSTPSGRPPAKGVALPPAKPGMPTNQ
jgi:hypothetical protein